MIVCVVNCNRITHDLACAVPPFKPLCRPWKSTLVSHVYLLVERASDRPLPIQG